MKESPAPIINTSFYIAGDNFSPEEAALFIGLAPTEYRTKGDLRKNLPPVLETCLAISVENQRLYSVDEAVRAVLDILWPCKEKINEYVKKNNLKVSIASNIKIYDDRPVYDLTTETMRRMVFLNIDFIMDVFDYRE